MSLILHEMAHSPYCIPVKRFLEAYGVSFELVTVPAWDRKDLARLTGGAYYQVPVLEHEGNLIHETQEDPLAVAHYLDEKFSGGALFPDHCAGLQELIIPQIENDLEGNGFKIGDPAYTDRIEDIGARTMVIRHKERSFGVGCVEEWRKNNADLVEAFENGLEPFELRLANVSGSYLFGDVPVYTDYALYGVIGNVLFDGSRKLNPRFESLIRWMEDLENFSA